ncbi:MAG: peptidyl-prolyl cis-trans isomerase cyclophilin type [Francisellaceae bacterium]|nr:peptidyl-prolyl cis-trans isomerase cyclophilin type [Francisellaceae bacterium]
MTNVIVHTNHGAIKIQIEDEKTPETARNFLSYVDQAFYDNTIFHRVIKGFMIQGGGFEANMQQKNTQAPIKNEAKTGLKNEIGTVAMARTPQPHSASSQFFINVNNNSFLDYKNDSQEGFGYCAFAKVIEGMDIVNKISMLPTTSKAGHQDVPMEAVIIEKIEREVA